MSKEFRLGIFVTLGLFVLAAAVIVIGDFPLQRHYTIHVLFGNTTGLPEKSKVRIAGVTIGKVARISLRGDKADVIVNIRPDVQLHEDAEARIVNIGLIGSKYLEMTTGSDSAPLLKNGAIIRGIDPVPLDRAVSNILEKLDALTGGFGGEGGNLGENLSITLRNLRQLSDKLNKSFTEEGLDDIATNVRDFSRDAAAAAQKINQALSRADIATAASSLSKVIERLDKLLTKIESGEGLVGKLVTDKDMGEELKTTIGSLKDTSEQAQRALRRLNLIKTYWDYTARYDFSDELVRHDAGITIYPRENKFYQLGVSNIKDTSSETDSQIINTIDAQIGGEVLPGLVLHGGVIRSRGGFGLRYRPFYPYKVGKKFELESFAYDFARKNPARPNINIGARFTPTPWLVVGMRSEDVSNTANMNGYLNLNIADDDIAYLLGLIGLAKP